MLQRVKKLQERTDIQTPQEIGEQGFDADDADMGIRINSKERM